MLVSFQGVVFEYAFEHVGEYDVSLTVADDGATGQGTVTVGVEPGAGELALVDVHPDAPGRRVLDEEYLVFRNVGDGPLDVSGWTVHDTVEETGCVVREGDHTFTFEDGPELAPETILTLRTGTGETGVFPDRAGEYHRYWGRSWFAVWDDEGDVVVKDDDDNPVLAASYERSVDGYVVEPLDIGRLELLFPDAPGRARGGDGSGGVGPIRGPWTVDRPGQAITNSTRLCAPGPSPTAATSPTSRRPRRGSSRT